MADVKKTIFVKVLTLDPAKNKLIPVPDAGLLCEDNGFLWDPDLSDGSHSTNAAGVAEVEITFDEDEETSLNPFFTIRIPEGSRTVPGGVPAERQFTLPEEWVTRHYVNRRIPRITDYTDPNKPLTIIVGLPAHLKIGYADFDASGIRNPFALPQYTLRVHLADYDAFIFDWLNPDDTMTGLVYNPRAKSGEKAVIEVGENDIYPYYDTWPTASCALDDEAPAAPRAWIDPPKAPVGVLGGGSFAQTGPVATDGHGFVFMIDGDLVRRFYPEGTLCETIGGPGGLVTFNNPGGIALDQYRNLYVADTGNDRIVFLRPNWSDGQLVGTAGLYDLPIFTGTTGAGNGQFNTPRGLAVVPVAAVDQDELLAVADTGNHRIQVFNLSNLFPPNGSKRSAFPFTMRLNYRTQFGAPAAGSSAAAATPVAGELWEPVDVTADRQGRLFVCDRAWHRVSRWAPAAVGTGYIHEADWEKSGGGRGSGDREFDTPEAVAVDLKENVLYVAESGNKRVKRLDADSGDHRCTWQHAYTPALGSDFTPDAVGVDTRGEIYIADVANQRVIRATPFDGTGATLPATLKPEIVGQPWTPHGEPAHTVAPAYVCYGPDGRLWISDTGNHRVLVFEPGASGELTLAAGRISGDFDSPVGVTIDHEDNIFVADSGNHRLRKFDASLNHVADIGPAPPAAGGSPPAGAGDDAFNHPRGMCIARQVEPVLYVADRDNNRVKMHKLSGEYIGSINGDGSNPLKKPEDVAVDDEGRLYVADTGNKKILQFSLTMDGPVSTAPQFVRAITPTGRSFVKPCGISLDEDAKLIVTDQETDKDKIYHLESDGDILGLWDLNALVRQDVVLDMIYHPELARLLRFNSPTRAAINADGLLAVADTGHDRVRLIRTRTQINLNLFDIGQGLFEKLPDISFRAIAETDWREDLGLKLNVGNINVFDDSHDFITDPQDDFADDVYQFRKILDGSDFNNAAVNVLKVARTVQKWYRHHSRMADPERRWGTKDNSRHLDIDLETRSMYFLDVNLDKEEDAPPHGRGADAWDDSVVAHEMSHWVFTQNTLPYPIFPLNPVRWAQMSGRHYASQITSYTQALSEGWAAYVEHFWGDHYGSTDRIRGFGMARNPIRSLHPLIGIAEEGKPDQYPFGGPVSAGIPTFAEPEKALKNEGFFSNALYQIHRALISPDVMFAYSPAYWHGYNVHLSDEQSRRFSDTIWKALKRFQEDPPFFDAASRVFFTKLLGECHAAQPQFAQVVQSIFELNNQLMPKISIAEETAGGGAGDALGEAVDLAAGDEKTLIIMVKDVARMPLRGYHLKIEVKSGKHGHFSLPADPGPKLRHGRPGPASPPATEFYRATDTQGTVNLLFNAPQGDRGSTDTIEVSHQPDFDHDETFSPPEPGDDLETTLRRLYLYELRAAAKTWKGTDNNWGAVVKKSLRINIQ